MGPMLFQSRIESCFIFADDLPVNYFLNAKSGCSTVLAHMWKGLDRSRGTSTFMGDPHAFWLWGRVSALTVDAVDAIVARPTFTLVRNPFTRVLSCYLSKVAERDEAARFTWGVICERFGLAQDTVISFDTFLDLIGQEPVEMMDIHWAPQAINLMQPVARIDHIFYLENMAPASAFLDHHFPGSVERSAHGYRDAQSKLAAFYTSTAIEKVKRIYAADFDLFGYSRDIGSLLPVMPIASLNGRAQGLDPMLKHIAAKTWEEKLEYLDVFEGLNGIDYSTALTRFCCGGEEASRTQAADRVLEEESRNWIVLRHIEAMYRAHDQQTRAALFGAAAGAAHQTMQFQAARPGTA